MCGALCRCDQIKYVCTLLNAGVNAVVFVWARYPMRRFAAVVKQGKEEELSGHSSSNWRV